MQQTNSMTAGRTTALLPLALFAGLCTRVPAAVGGGAVFLSWEWAPGIGVNLDFAVDGLSVLFGLIISGIGVFVVLFSADYMRGHRHYVRFFVFLHLFLLSMLGLVFADNLITLFVFWELTTVLSYLLIGFDNENETARRHARQALLVTGAGGLALLIGFLMIGGLAGTYRLSALAEQARVIQRARPLRSHPRTAAHRRLHQVRPVSVSFLAAQRHDRPDPDQRLPAFGHHGQGRHLPAGPLSPDSGRDGRLDGHARHRRRHHGAAGRRSRHCPVGPKTHAGLHDHHGPGHSDHVSGRERPPRR